MKNTQCPVDFDDMYEECFECNGEGWILDDCFEDTCFCLNPEEDHDLIPCPVCNPGGKYK